MVLAPPSTFLSPIVADMSWLSPPPHTQDNGAGSPLHFAVTYRQLDMAHHLINNGAAVNQRDTKTG